VLEVLEAAAQVQEMGQQLPLAQQILAEVVGVQDHRLLLPQTAA
jgi:hypothetical protein